MHRSRIALGLAATMMGLTVVSMVVAAEPRRAPIDGTWVKVRAKRFAENPIIRPGMPGLSGRNINGPTLLKVPSWIEKPLGTYYLYFADHGGKFIRMAYAHDLHGPWTIHAPGVLKLEDTAARGHIASPDILVDEEERQIRMYFHGPARGGQMTFVALSKDGLHFEARPDILAPFYLRVFRHGGYYYGLAKDKNESGVLVRSRDGLTAFERGPNVIWKMRHCALLPRGRTLWVFFSRIGDAPEQIAMTRFDLNADWTQWEATAPPYVPVLKPEMPYEGVHFPLKPSSPGAAMDVQQLRDPFIHAEAGRLYVLYTVAGEVGIAIAELTFSPAEAAPGK